MKTRISLLVACLAFTGMGRPVDALIINNAPSPQTSTRVKDLEIILHKSRICKDYASVVKISDDNIVIVATYADRGLSEQDIKILAFNIAKFVWINVDNAKEIKVRLYDPASIKYWNDIEVSAAQIKEGSISEADLEKVLESIKVLNNFGLVDGPNLEARVGLYKQILKVKSDGIPVKPYLAKLQQIETTEKNRRDITPTVAELNKSLAAVQKTLTQPISSGISSTGLEATLRQTWQDACDREKAALQVVENAEQEQKALGIPEAFDNDAQARYEIEVQALQKKVNTALDAWHQACQDRDITFQALSHAKHY